MLNYSFFIQQNISQYSTTDAASLVSIYEKFLENIN